MPVVTEPLTSTVEIGDVRPTMAMLDAQLSELSTWEISAEARVFVGKCRAWLETKKVKKGTPAKPIKKVYRSVMRFKQALRARTDDNSSVRRMAEKTLRSVRHEDFPEIHQRLRRLHVFMSRIDRRKARKRQQGLGGTIELDPHFELRELASVKNLQRVGRTLELCVAKQETAYNYLSVPGREMWVLYDQTQQCPLCLLSVDRPAKEICKIEGHNHSTPRLERSLAFDIIRALHVNADKVRAFGRAGAFHAFLCGEPDVKPFEFEECMYWLWILDNGAEIIIATETGLSDKRWSRFAWNDASRVLEGNGWNHLSKGELLALMVNHPSFAGLHRLLPSEGDGEVELLWSTILRLSRGFIGTRSQRRPVFDMLRDFEELL